MVPNGHEIAMRCPALQSDAIPTPYEPTQMQLASNVLDLTNEASETDTNINSEVVIGSVMSNGCFKCVVQGCYRRSFGRQAELRRHYYGAHTNKLGYWCETAGCPRSKEMGYRPFPRKDKLMSHVRKVHGGVA
jgi:hypothetical protein